MTYKASIIVVMAAVFAIFHILTVAVPILTSGGSGETQAFAAAILDIPISWLLSLSPTGREVLYGSWQLLYILVFSIGGTLMYAAVGALVGCGIHVIIRAFRAA